MRQGFLTFVLHAPVRHISCTVNQSLVQCYLPWSPKLEWVLPLLVVGRSGQRESQSQGKEGCLVVLPSLIPSRGLAVHWRMKVTEKILSYLICILQANSEQELSESTRSCSCSLRGAQGQFDFCLRPASMYTEAWLSGPQSTQFYTRIYKPPIAHPKAVIVFIHGFSDHIGRYTHFHPLFNESGIAVFTFDQRGFGKSAQDQEGHKSKESAYGKTSWNEQMTDIEWAVQHAKKEFPEVPVFLMGHSMVSKLQVPAAFMLDEQSWPRREAQKRWVSPLRESTQFLVRL